MTAVTWAFDLLLAAGVVGVAAGALGSRDPFRGVVLFIVFGLLVALVWARLAAPDLALAEAALGAGITGALFLSSLSRAGARPLRDRLRGPLVPAVAAAAAGLLLVWGMSALPVPRPDLSAAVSSNLEAVGVENPVTAVLLGFRAYDTLLEVGVLLLAVLGVSSLDLRAAPPGAPMDRDVVQPLAARLSPVMVVVGAYLLWRGADAPGGAFQAGAIWGAIGVLWLLSREEEPRVSAAWVRAALSFGLAVFLAAAVATAIAGGSALEYPRGWSKLFIVTIETAAALSIGATLTVLYAGRLPEGAR